jgi:NAD(P)-dependent dehydrogenase (short-subunit alcohol dehydrogenase family)
MYSGGGSGFGAATTLLFASEGARVLIADLNEEGAKKVAAKASENGSVVYQKANVTARQSWVELIERIKNDFGGQLDIVVNNAGTSYPYKPTLSVTEEDYDTTMAVNCKSIFWSVNVCVPHMLKGGRGGAFVNTASIGGSRPRPGLVWYAASKGTVVNVTHILIIPAERILTSF